MTAVPPSVVHSVSGPSNASPHILSKHTATATTVTHTHPQLHADRPAERHVDRPAEQQTDRQPERQADMLLQLDRQGQICSSSSSITTTSSCSVAPPSGATVSMRPNSPPLPTQTSGTCSRKHFICKLAVHLINYFYILCFYFSGSVPGTPKLSQLPGRTSQKVKATLANIPVGNYEGGGRGKEREREKDRERDKEKEREAAGSGHFSFDAQSSPSTHPVEEPPSERAPESSSTADSSEARSRDGATTKEARGTDTCSPVTICAKKPQLI